MGLFIHFATWGYEDQGISLKTLQMPNGDIELQCGVTGDRVDSSTIYLGCDFRNNTVCRENCDQICPIINGHSNCTGLVDDDVVSCRYSHLSNSKVIVTYELNSAYRGSEKTFWCLYRGIRSPTFTHTPLVEKSRRGRSLSRSQNFKSAQQEKEHLGPEGDTDTLQMRFTAEAVLIIAICTIASCILNLVFCICCQLSRRYLNSLAKGGSRNRATEKCLCIKSLADTYRPRRNVFTRGGLRSGGSSVLWSRLGNQGSLKAPLSEPMPRRKPLTYFPSFHPQISIQPRPPPPDEVIYDDVHQSTVYLNHVDSASRQNLTYEVYPPSASVSSGNGQKCIVDQNGTIYVAMGHVSQTPQQVRANLTASRVTLTTFQPEASPRLSQKVKEQHSPPRSGQFLQPENLSGDWTMRKNPGETVQKLSGIDQGLASLPPQPSRGDTVRSGVKTVSISSGLNPPVPFADRLNNDDKFGDFQNMSKDTPTPKIQANTLKSNPSC